MTFHLTTPHGDTVAYDSYGSGPPLIFVAGVGSFRDNAPTTTATAQLVAQQGLTTITYDRPGRGESTGAPPFDLAGETAALQALIDTVGGTAMLCGHSSGSALALYAAAAGLPITRLALWEVPIIGTAHEVQQMADEFIRLLEADDHRAAIEYFTKDIPAAILTPLKASPIWEDMIREAQSQRPDAEALAWFHSAPPHELLTGITIPILTMVGQSSFEAMHQAADAIATLPNAEKIIVPGQVHGWEPAPMAAELVRFCSAA